MKFLGIALVVVGIVALAYGGFSYTRQKTLIDVGPIKATTTEHHNIPLSPIVGAITIVSGLVLLVVPRHRTA